MCGTILEVFGLRWATSPDLSPQFNPRSQHLSLHLSKDIKSETQTKISRTTAPKRCTEALRKFTGALGIFF